jgi:hypothetical protein
MEFLTDEDLPSRRAWLERIEADLTQRLERRFAAFPFPNFAAPPPGEDDKKR